MSNWYFIIAAPGILWIIYYHIRRRRFVNWLEARRIYHDKKFWADYYPQFQRARLIAVISDLSKALGLPVELIDPADKLADITVNDVLNSDELDDAAIILVMEYGVDKKKLQYIITVDDYIHAAMGEMSQ